jgi:hypothetical protein
MPSQKHEVLVDLFRSRPQLAPQLMREVLDVPLPPYTDVEVGSADLTEVQPTEYRADLVLSLSNEASQFSIIVEVQLSRDDRKRFAWPAYVANLRARRRCPVCLLVVCPDSAVAEWAAKPVSLGCKNLFAPRVLDSHAVPKIVDSADAAKNPDLAILSALAHGHDPDAKLAAQIAAVAQGASMRLDEDRAQLYFDLILNSLSEAAREVLLETMRPFKYEYQSDFVKGYVAQGRAEGRVEGRAEGRAEGRVAILTRQLTARFGSLSDEAKVYIASKSIEELDAVADRLLTAASLEEALDPKN